MAECRKVLPPFLLALYLKMDILGYLHLSVEHISLSE